MAIGSLTNFSVPLQGGGTSQPNQGLLMPKLKFRFRLTFINFGDPAAGQDTVELTKQVQDVKRPSLNFNPITIDVYNSKIYLQGKPEWGEITITLRDDAGGYVTSLIGAQIQSQFDFEEQASAASGIDYKFQLLLEVLDGGNGGAGPTTLESWQLYGCFISQVDYGDLNYATNEQATIQLTVRYDNAEQLPQGSQTNPGGVGFYNLINSPGGLSAN
jgi:hypothetical protein